MSVTGLLYKLVSAQKDIFIFLIDVLNKHYKPITLFIQGTNSVTLV